MIEQGGVLGSLPAGIRSWAEWSHGRGSGWEALIASSSYAEWAVPYVGWLSESYCCFSHGWSLSSPNTWSEE